MARPLKIFMRGKRISMLQDILRRMGYAMHDQAGQFGASTRDAVKAFQRQRDLKPTGSVDDALLILMQQGSCPENSKSEPPKLESPQTTSSLSNQTQLDALIELLINKGIINEDELKQRTRPQPMRVTQKPLV
ncbi:MAG: peptidoglycan-binding protein [Mariprofundus sp.]|nr:peptidoglycan-binding protein [Mariprofundus sp.]